MKAIVRDRYGSPDVLELANVDEPVLGAADVLVRVRAASLKQRGFLREARVVRTAQRALCRARRRTERLGALALRQREACGPR